MARVMNSDSIARLIARELRSGNKLKPCDGCLKERPTKRIDTLSLCAVCYRVTEGVKP